MAEVMERIVPARRSIAPTFLFLAGPDPPEFYVTHDSTHLAEFAADWMYRRIVSKPDLLRLFDVVVDQYPLAHGSGYAG